MKLYLVSNYNLDLLKRSLDTLLTSLYSDIKIETILIYNSLNSLAVLELQNKIKNEDLVVFVPQSRMSELSGRKDFDLYLNDLQNSLNIFSGVECAEKFIIVPELFSEIKIIAEINQNLANSLLEREILHDYIKIERVKFIDLQEYFLNENQSELFDLRFWFELESWMTIKMSKKLAKNIFDEFIFPDKFAPKIIYVDGDETLWEQILGEDGIEKIENNKLTRLGVFHDSLQKILKLMRVKGVLLVLVTKNNLNDVQNLLNLDNLMLGAEDFLTIIADWKPKSALIQEHLLTLNISPQDCLFLDNNPIEIGDINTRIPAMKTILVGESIKDKFEILVALNKMSFALSEPTDEDNKRISSYKGLLQSQVLLNSETFDIRHLNMRMEIWEASEKDLPRVAQILSRTNQFNTNKISYEDYYSKNKAKSNDNDMVTLLFSLSDKFANHGITGISIISRNSSDLYFIECLAISCRVLQRGAEWAFLQHIFLYLAKKGPSPRISLKYKKTERNIPAMYFVAEILNKSALESIDQLEELEVQLGNEANLWSKKHSIQVTTSY